MLRTNQSTPHDQSRFDIILVTQQSWFYRAPHLACACVLYALETGMDAFFLSIWVTYESMWSVVFVGPAGRLVSQPSCMAKTLTLDITRKLFHQFFSYLPYLLAPVTYHYTPLFLTLTLPGGHKASAKQIILASFSHILFNWSGLNLMWCWSNSSWTSWYYFWLRLSGTREITAASLTLSNENIVCMPWNDYWLLRFKHGMKIDTSELNISIVV